MIWQIDMRSPATALALAVALALPCPAALAEPQQDPKPELQIHGLSRSGKTALFRRGENLVLLGNDSKQRSLPADTRKLQRRHRYGASMEGKDDTRLRVRGRSISVARDGAGLTAGRGGKAAPAPLVLPEGCKIASLHQGMLAWSRRAAAAVLALACEEAPTVREHPVVVWYPSVARRQMARVSALTRAGKLKRAAKALDIAAALGASANLVTYTRARLAALGADQAGCLRWLKKLRARGTAAARRLLVKARWDDGFRLVKDSAAFKSVTDLR